PAPRLTGMILPGCCRTCAHYPTTYDPIVISHARSLLAKSPGVIAVPGDMRDPGRILADPGLTELIDLAEPACVIVSRVHHLVDPATARAIADGFAQAIAPGSYLIISVGSGTPSEGG